MCAQLLNASLHFEHNLSRESMKYQKSMCDICHLFLCLRGKFGQYQSLGRTDFIHFFNWFFMKPKKTVPVSLSKIEEKKENIFSPQTL